MLNNAELYNWHVKTHLIQLLHDSIRELSTSKWSRNVLIKHSSIIAIMRIHEYVITNNTRSRGIPTSTEHQQLPKPRKKRRDKAIETFVRFWLTERQRKALSPTAPQPLSPSAPQPHSHSAPQPLSHSAPQPLSPSAPRPLGPTALQPHSPSAPQPLSPTAPQPCSPYISGIYMYVHQYNIILWFNNWIFMGHKAISLPQGLMYIYMFVSLTWVFVVYVVKEFASF